MGTKKGKYRNTETQKCKNGKYFSTITFSFFIFLHFCFSAFSLLGSLLWSEKFIWWFSYFTSRSCAEPSAELHNWMISVMMNDEGRPSRTFGVRSMIVGLNVNQQFHPVHQAISSSFFNKSPVLPAILWRDGCVEVHRRNYGVTQPHICSCLGCSVILCRLVEGCRENGIPLYGKASIKKTLFHKVLPPSPQYSKKFFFMCISID